MSRPVRPTMQFLVDVSEGEFHHAWTRTVGTPHYDKEDWIAVDRARDDRRRLALAKEMASAPPPQSVTIAIRGTYGLTIKSDPSMPRDTFGFDPGYPGSMVFYLAVDPLDVEYDGWSLRKLLEWDEQARRSEDRPGGRGGFTPAQRVAISAHWSAELHAKVAAAKQKEREQVVVDRQDEP